MAPRVVPAQYSELLRLFYGVNAYLLALLVKSFKGNNAVYLCEDRIVSSQADIIAGMYFCTELTDNNSSRTDLLAAEHLYAAPLGVAVATVTGTSLSFFMCHGFYPLNFRWKFL